jgi:hypothetical protein
MEEFASDYSGYEDQAKAAYMNAIAEQLRSKGIEIDYEDNLLRAKRVSLVTDGYVIDWLKKLGFTEESRHIDAQYSNATYIKRYSQGGLVPYTGLAQVDGSRERPEAFLSADDTERIGTAAKLLSDIPALNRSNISTSNTSYGDTNVEINLNIDHISSDVDIEEMLERVKQEIVDIARPIGTNVILQQQV